MPELSFDDVSRMLNIYGPDPYVAFKQDWCARKIQACSSSRGGINTKYSHELAEKLCFSFNVSFIGKLFGCLKSIDNLSAFEDLIDFCSREKINLNDILENEYVELNDLIRLVEAKHLIRCAKSQPESEAEEKQFLQIFQTLYDAGWNFVQMRDLVAAFNPIGAFNRFRNLLHFLNTIQIYGLFSISNFEKSKQILIDTTSFQMMMQKLNKIAIENHFQLEGKVKDLNELVAELKKSNKHDQALVYFIEKGALNIRKHIFEKQSAKLQWKEKQIYLWAKDIKSSRKEFSDYEGIAVILRANFLITGHTLTDTQILCSLIALRTGGSLKGKLLEVATGEGKSTIICILAIINALRGNLVDVITSSPVLAERDAKQKAKLYRMFCLTCSDNNDKTVYLRGRKSCYSADIVYGEMSQFQFDILRDSYSKLGTLGGRKFTTAIVDEVDSMLIDDSSKIARLSSTISGMDHFQAIYVFIWQRLISIKEKFIMFNSKLYFVDGKVGFEDGKITLEVVDSNNDIWKIPDLEEYLVRAGDKSQVGEYVGDDVDEYLRNSLEHYLDCQIKENKIYVPSNFADFLQKQKPKWITNAVEALNYQENVHYVVQDGEIKPVDYYSTGIVQSSTSWSDGLHQFLQLKHNLKMTSETITTNFLSNMGLMNKYEQVYGLTGTLGSETARGVLKKVYGVDLINIPQRRQKQYLELESIVAEGEANWLKEIMSNIIHEIQKDRGILVICETIENTNRISGMLKNKLPPSSVKLYAMNDMNQEKNVEKILPGEVIIATNLAGRGTDIQTDEIEATGGLHVILTFMPSNQRVEDQAFGRTARQGKRGTGLMILNGHHLVGYASTTTTKSMKMDRDGIESEQLKNFQDFELKPIQVKDKMFDVFCAFLNDEIRLRIRQEQDTYGNRVMNSFTEVPPTMYECSVLAAVEEQWAGFLSKLDEKVIQCEDAETKCQELINQLRQDFVVNSVIKNPYHYICIANDILASQSPKAEQVKRALSYFEKAVELEQKSGSSNGDESLFCPGAAHAGIAWCWILLKEEGYKEEALSSFKSALTCLSNEMSVLNATQLLLEQKQAGKLYFVDGKVGFEDGKITLEVVDSNNDIGKIPDLEEYLVRAGDKSQVGEYVGDDVDEYLRNSLEHYLDCQIKENKIYVPSNFADFLQKQKPKWITNAVEALNYQENVHYVVQDGEIKPVDYYSTGIVQSSTSWSDGLHQFLQLKHNLKMTSETITTNFLSNMGLMNKYEQVYGLTGTLGSETARGVLKKVYGVDLINIPQRRQKQYLELESIVAEGEANWLKEIMSNIIHEIQKDRGILVICETIENTNRISGMLKNKLPPSSVKLYAMNDMNQEKNVEKILPGEVIIATNLAGRGTDIQTDEIEATGGLHVILTFMPSNQRVEDQAFGRTARQGKRGTGLMILNGHHLVGYASTTTTKSMKMDRDGIESEQLKNFQDFELKPIQVKDKMFDVFCAFLNDEIRLRIRQEQDTYGNRVMNSFTEVPPTMYECSVLAAVEEQWAGFLSKLDEKVIKCEDAETKCQELINQLRQDFVDNSVIKNPYHYICIANDMLANQSPKAEQVKRALSYFEKAVELEQKSGSNKGDECGSNASMAIRVIGTLNGLHQVQTLTDNVVKALVTKLRRMYSSFMTISLVFHRHLKIKKVNTALIADKLKQLHIFDDVDNFNVSQSDLVNVSKELKRKIDEFSEEEFGNDDRDSMTADVGKSIAFIESFYAKFVEIDLESFSMMMKSVSDQIAEQLIRVMDSQLLQPWSTLAVSNLSAAGSKRLQHYCFVDEEQNSDSHKADQKKYEELKEKKDLTTAERSFMANYGRFRTFEEQIKYNSMDYCEAYSQCEMAYHAGQDGGHHGQGTPDANVKQIADGVRAGGPTNLATMIAMAKGIGVNLKVVDDERYVRTQEDIDNGVQVMYVKHGPNDEVGHAYYMNSNGQFSEAPSVGYDSAFAAFSKILESNGISKSVSDLRVEAADRIESNSTSFLKVLSAENWIRKTKPDSANKLLFTAGLYRDADGVLRVEPGDAVALADAISKKNEHPRGGKFAKIFKFAIPRNIPDSPTEKSVLHIIPYNQRDAAVRVHDTRQATDTAAEAETRLEPLRAQLENFVNEEHMKTIIEGKIDDQGRLMHERQLMNQGDVGTFLHTAISYNPNNLARDFVWKFRGDKRLGESSVEKEGACGPKLEGMGARLKKNAGQEAHAESGDTKYFESKEQIDSLYSKDWQDAEPCYPDATVTTIEQVSFREALKLMTVDIWCTMDYFLANRDEMEKDLGRKLPNLDLDDKDLLKQLEDELFHKQSVKIFGREEGDDEKSAVTFTDFRHLFFDGNERFGTARHGKHYVVFFHVTG
ncbi:unnamed protein product [Darwinula stevensoni]|uniref:Protein translocase subunit SecA n=1 Tax=Darwinula stevensoni TaxID=69355 RepID=A0A7R8XFH2_9CRUS|nr:unnamed protein product [Darwinula stevensoni]CAG0890702.1 unnamed protein product [Darwinula stevensoni]